MMFPISMQISVAKTPSTDSWRRLSNSGSSGSKSLTCRAKRGLKRANIQINGAETNRPFATSDHVVQNPPCWRASALLFPQWDIKTKRPEPVKLDLPLF